MVDLRRWLGERDVSLYGSLEHSWELAQNTWLPALGAKAGSHNGYPHLRNLESYLNRVCEAFSLVGAGSEADEQRLSPVEAYLLLAGILFHDLGRLQRSDGHGNVSRQWLEAHWSQHGIPTKEMALLIGDLCEYHEPSGDRSKVADRLTQTSMAPYGRIRRRELASLLRLVDEMDGAFTRVVPEYLRSVQAPGIFRALVQDVRVDAKSQTLYTVLGDGIADAALPRTSSSEYRYTPVSPGSGAPAKWCRPECPFNPEKSQQDEIAPALLRDVSGDTGERFHVEEWLLSRGLVHVDRDPENPSKGWNARMLAAALLASLRKSSAVLREERSCLMRLGIHLRGWVLEYKEHLYDESGSETVEAILYKGYIEDIAQRMWELSTQVFGRAEHTYRELAVAARETDVDKVRLAVNRLAILMQDGKRGGDPKGIWAGPEAWQCSPGVSGDASGGDGCLFLGRDTVKKILREIREIRTGE